VALADKNGNQRASMAVVGEDADVALWDQKSKKRASLRLDADSPSLAICDEEGNRRAVLGCNDLLEKRTGVVRKKPECSLTLVDEEGKVLTDLP
jgi:hypothetical protein